MSETQKRPAVRLNLNKPRHRQAWEYLQSRKDQSHTEVIVDALIHRASAELPNETLNVICGTVREAVQSAIHEAFHAGAYVSSVALCFPDEPVPMTEEDYDAAMEFMDGL